MSSLTLAREHRADLATLTGLAEDDLARIWERFNPLNAAACRDALIEVLPELVAVYGSAAATLGAEFYDDMRADAKVSGRFSGIAADLPDQGATDVLARWAVTPLFGAEPDAVAALSNVTGGLQKIVADVGRASVVVSSQADSRSSGWQRVASGKACGFCQMLAGRGFRYSKSSTDFSSHNRCHCVAVSVWGDEMPVKPYTPTDRNITDADRARVREWIKNNQ